MKIYHSLLVLLFLFISTHLIASSKEFDVIYGEDNRLDVYASTDSFLVETSKSTAAMINEKNLSKRDGEVVIEGRTLKERGICSSERFSHQKTAANCSGFLVSENRLVTAGHCIRSEADCQFYKWVFDYKVENEEQVKVSVPESSIYSCKKIISRTLDNSTMDDYAFIELDREVTDRRPLNFRRSGKITRGESLAVIGHPTGLPTKIADGAKVRSTQGKFFVANLDTYGGNSGSAVVNTTTFEVEGILVRGDTDYVFDSQKGCQVSNQCTDAGCRGEDVTYITNIPELNLENELSR